MITRKAGQRHTTTGRAIAVLGLVVAMLATGVATGMAAASTPLPKAAKVSLLLGSNKRDVALLQGIKVKVKADRAVRVTLSVPGLSDTVRRVTFRKRGTTVSVFKLNPAGRKLFETCGNGSVPVNVSATYPVPVRGSRTKTVDRTITASIVVTWTGPNCTVTPPPA